MATPRTRIHRPFYKAKRLADEVREILEDGAKNNKISFQYGGRNVPLDIEEVVVGGSVAHGTALPGKFDIDLVVLAKNPHLKELGKGIHVSICDQMMECIEDGLTNQKKVVEGSKNRNYLGWTFKAWHFNVDLSLSIKWPSPADMYRFLEPLPKQERKLFASGASCFQTQLMRPQSYKAKVLIKRFKAWRDAIWDSRAEKGGRPKSYFLSLLVIHVYKDAPGHLVRLRSIAIWLMQEIINLVKKCAEDPKIDLQIPGPCSFLIKEDDLDDPPCITDSINPFVNFYKRGLGEIEKGDTPEQRWRIFAKEIESLNLILNIT